MANVAHASLTGANLHEPKGVASASANTVYVANGSGSGSWTSPPASAGTWTLIATNTPSGASSTSFTGFSSSSYKDYKIVIDHLVPNTSGAVINLRTSTNGGSSYASGSTNYQYINSVSAGSTVITNGTGTTGASEIQLSNKGISNTSGYGLSGIIDILTPGSAAVCVLSWQFIATLGAATGYDTYIAMVNGVGQRAAAADVDAVQIYPDSGTISGTLRFYGLKV